MEYKVSVIIPVYNRENIIKTAVGSALCQTLKDVEIIIVDDGSTDRSFETARSFASDYPNIKVYQQENAGSGIACNTGLEHATGEYVIFLDSDGWVPEGAYEALYHKARETDADVVVGQLLRKNDGGKWFNPPHVKEVFDKLEGQNCAKNFELPIQIPSCCVKLLRRNLLEKNQIHFCNAHLGEDFLFSVEVFQSAQKIYTINDIVYMFSSATSENSQITNTDANMIDCSIEALKSCVLFFDKIGHIEWEDANLNGSFSLVLQCFLKLPENEKKAAAFESIKGYLSNYKGRPEYKITIEYLMGMDLDILLTLPYSAYRRQKEFLRSRQMVQQSASPRPVAYQEDPKTKVLEMYQNGEIGLPYIIKYLMAWFHFKIKGKK